jgi:anaerobic ribonucleoside-triphosphate reductase activating protein
VDAKMNVILGADVVNASSLVVGGFVPLTTIDFPDHLSAVIFCQGCPFDCPYCHNPDLIVKRVKSKYTWSTIISFLIKRRNLLEAVVFSGGEPTLQKELINAIHIVKKLGFKIGLHTAGPYPDRLKALLPNLDWVGMDIKAPFEQYESITKVPNSGKRAFESVKILLESKIPCEFRTTVYPQLITNEQILIMASTLKNMGATNYKLQQYRKIYF